MTVDFIGVSYTYPSQTDPLFRGLCLAIPRGWTGVAGSNGCGKTTLLHLAHGALEPAEGTIRKPGVSILCEQRTDSPPEGLETLLEMTDGAAHELIGRLGLELDWIPRWETLSHGERKRAQIACALYRKPEVLLLDEPTNHIDTQTRDFLLPTLKRYGGIGLIVSHDRKLLDALCGSCVLFGWGEPRLRPGGYTHARAEAEREVETMRKERERARHAYDALEADAARRRVDADAADARRSRRHIAPGDHDAKARINLARLTGKDGKAGRLLRQLDGRLKQAHDRAEAIFVPKERTLGMTLRGQRAAKPVLLQQDACSIPICPGRELQLPQFELKSSSRIGICGPNGSGKTTLVRHLMATVTLAPEQVLYVPQETDAESAASVVGAVRKLEHHQLGPVMATLACLGSDPGRLIETELPSPGEVRKLLFALGLLREPNLIVMDEPTNHLDLPSIECLEDALKQCQCALILVSHDQRLLRATTSERWTLQQNGAATRLETAPWPAA